MVSEEKLNPSRRGAALSLLAGAAVAASPAQAFRPGDGLITGKENCRVCRFYEPTNDGTQKPDPVPGLDGYPRKDWLVLTGADGLPLGWGRCRRYAPTDPSKAARERNKDSGVFSDGFCGEYRGRA